MTQVNRIQLKEYFQKGKRPAENDFADLIDSVPNIVDDGNLIRDKNGLHLYPMTPEGKILQIFRTQEDSQSNDPSAALWKIVLNDTDQSLSLTDSENAPLLTLKKDRTLVINGKVTVTEGLYSSKWAGTLGRPPGDSSSCKVPADGNWHDAPLPHAHVPGENRIYHIVAGCDKGSNGKCALLEATILCGHGGQRRIRSTGSWTTWFLNKIRLRWAGSQTAPILQIRTRSNYGADKYIHFRITELWNDTDQ